MQRETNKQLREIYDRFSRSEKPIHRAYMESIHSLVNLAEARDPYTKKHSVKVSNYAVGLAKYLRLPKNVIENIKLAAILHDIGKLGIREKILLKPSSLDEEEYNEVKKHPELGAYIIKPLRFFGEVIAIIKHHHENYNGTGYPDGLEGKDIPLGSQILAIADSYEALTSKRAYRDAYSREEALNIMRKASGKKFNPEFLKAFIECLSNKEYISSKEKERAT